jgi:hypothetical protein
MDDYKIISSLYHTVSIAMLNEMENPGNFVRVTPENKDKYPQNEMMDIINYYQKLDNAKIYYYHNDTSRYIMIVDAENDIYVLCYGTIEKINKLLIKHGLNVRLGPYYIEILESFDAEEEAIILKKYFDSI